jgi:hypothetical protein
MVNRHIHADGKANSSCALFGTASYVSVQTTLPGLSTYALSVGGETPENRPKFCCKRNVILRPLVFRGREVRCYTTQLLLG